MTASAPGGVPEAFYRALSTEQLDDYRTALRADLADARRRPAHAPRTVAFCTERVRAIEQVLRARGFTFRLDDDGRAITCLTCGRTSHHPEDVAQRYCGACHVFHLERSL